MKERIMIFPSLLLAWLLSAQALLGQEISIRDIKSDITFLASDSLKGRFPGTPESRVAADYIRNQFRQAGLKLLGDNGLQALDVVIKTELGKGNMLSFDGFQGKPGEDFTPFSFSANGTLTAEVVFGGYGFDISTDSLKWNDYHNTDVSGKWVLILRGDPDPDNPASQFLNFAEERSKVLVAKDKGAAGVIFASGPAYEKKDELISLHFDKSKSGSGIPVIDIRRSVADKLLEPSGQTIEMLEKELNNTKAPVSVALKRSVTASTEVLLSKVVTWNIVGVLEGSDPGLKNEYLVLGAHWDHLGFGGPSSGSRNPDTVAVHHGADDNASGVAGVIALAKKLGAAPEKPKRSLVFIAFAAEEQGLLGSKYFIEHPLVDLKKIKAMFNFDMVGRLKPDDRTIMISGTGTSVEGEEILKKLGEGRKFSLKFSPEGFGASDHASFYSENIPVFFVTTGIHEDYHLPRDLEAKIDYEGEKEVMDYSCDLVKYVADLDKDLTFREAGPKTEASSPRRFKVTLGILPDFASSEENGLRVDGTRKGGPAELGGILKGDVIVALNGKSVKNIYDYMFRLKDLEPGKTAIVDILRGGQKLVLLIQL